MIQYYFQLQLKIIARRLSAFGLIPGLALVIAPILFIALSMIVFSRFPFSEYIYPLIPIYLIFINNNRYKTRFMKSYFSGQQQTQIRVLENLLITIPFVIVLVVKQHFFIAVILFFVSILISFFNLNRNYHSKLPTPFSQRPFEFAIGFRKSILLFIFATILMMIAIQVNNFNFGIVILGFTFLVPLAFYSYVEPKFYVQIFTNSPSQFLTRKIKTALLHILILTVPFSIILGFFFPAFYRVILFVNVLGIVLMIVSIIAKYSSYPKSITITDSILLAVSIIIPPLLFITIPQLYKKSVLKIRPFLT